jgi:hypothetical protein
MSHSGDVACRIEAMIQIHPPGYIDMHNIVDYGE